MATTRAGNLQPARNPSARERETRRADLTKVLLGLQADYEEVLWEADCHSLADLRGQRDAGLGEGPGRRLGEADGRAAGVEELGTMPEVADDRGPLVDQPGTDHEHAVLLEVGHQVTLA